MRSVKFGILLLIHCRVLINCWRLAPLVGGSIFNSPSSRRGSYLIPDSETMRPHQRISLAKKRHLDGCNLIFCSAQNRSICSTVSITSGHPPF